MVTGEIFRDTTRATKYQRKFELPPNFTTVLKDFTREVLRDQPPDIYQYAAQHFKKLALAEEGIDQADIIASQSPVKNKMHHNIDAEISRLKSQLVDAFGEEDYNKTGTLDVQTMKRVLAGSCQITNEQVLFLFSNCFSQLNHDGSAIDYSAFAEDNAKYVLHFMEKGYNFQLVGHHGEESVHGLTNEELKSALVHLFQQHDTTGTGRLPLRTFTDCLKEAELQLTKRDIALIIAEADVTADGNVLYAKEASTAFQLLKLGEAFDEFQAKWLAGSV
jgi:Ca2+-binding EF-hand superfamily protein